MAVDWQLFGKILISLFLHLQNEMIGLGVFSSLKFDDCILQVEEPALYFTLGREN